MAITAAMVKELREKTGLGMMDCKKALEEAQGDMTLAHENLRKKGQATAEKRAGKSAKEGCVSTLKEGNVTILFEVNCETDFVSKGDDFSNFISQIGAAFIAQKPATLEAALTADLGGVTVQAQATELMGKIGEKIVLANYILETAAENEATYSYVHSNGKVGALIKMSAEKSAVLSSDVLASLGSDLAMQVAASAPACITEDSLDPALVAKEKEIYLEQLKNEGKNAEMAEKIVLGKMDKFYKQVTLIKQEFIKADKTSVEQHIAAVAKEVGSKLTVVAMHRIELGASDTGSSED